MRLWNMGNHIKTDLTRKKLNKKHSGRTAVQKPRAVGILFLVIKAILKSEFHFLVGHKMQN